MHTGGGSVSIQKNMSELWQQLVATTFNAGAEIHTRT